ncbi:uncharacterized protein LACBIDRAFT_334011 [Laccaria bicolor S238N-H82]|uniref:Peptide hydrolase n=1 Tax=Laccaria bicolor (strain S238N-H82 / ATCC MYA-4686) TaxID=486041 RepID=B0DXT0_LACBS|nr:uncharacterized protein LACBIDRAFT_334011 [Laccaria bicolor S238N-H82]EDR00519.1 predicted protein [Laccaria bicolor S238N-H82]|eukprot:XP_001888746.1 predicted protein [Laccaria bicolor S238N-H82]
MTLLCPVIHTRDISLFPKNLPAALGPSHSTFNSVMGIVPRSYEMLGLATHIQQSRITARSCEMLGLVVNVWHSNMWWSGVHTQETKLLSFTPGTTTQMLETTSSCFVTAFAPGIVPPDLRDVTCCRSHTTFNPLGGRSLYTENHVILNYCPKLRDAGPYRSQFEFEDVESSPRFARRYVLSLTYNVQSSGEQKSIHRKSLYSPSPGAVDDAISVGIMLECMCVLIEMPTWSPKHAIIFFFNHAEESLQNGSQLYSTQHPTAPTYPIQLTNLQDQGGIGI